MLTPSRLQLSTRVLRYWRTTGPATGSSTISAGIATLMSRTASRWERTEVWQYWPFHWPANSSQNDGADAAAVGAPTVSAMAPVATPVTMAATTRTSMLTRTSVPYPHGSATWLARQRPSTNSMVILILLRSMRGSGT